MNQPEGIAQRRLLRIINFYKSLIDDGKLKEGGAGHTRYNELRDRYNSIRWQKAMRNGQGNSPIV
jgi:hypothetical protein|tara:strand:- start:8071 stop:8265 length:195 start_codon:yes stop_codon:yes gene_type:complete